jgi:hypothetical protein
LPASALFSLKRIDRVDGRRIGGEPPILMVGTASGASAGRSRSAGRLLGSALFSLARGDGSSADAADPLDVRE